MEHFCIHLQKEMMVSFQHIIYCISPYRISNVHFLKSNIVRDSDKTIKDNGNVSDMFQEVCNFMFRKLILP